MNPVFYIYTKYFIVPEQNIYNASFFIIFSFSSYFYIASCYYSMISIIKRLYLVSVGVPSSET